MGHISKSLNIALHSTLFKNQSGSPEYGRTEDRQRTESLVSNIGCHKFQSELSTVGGRVVDWPGEFNNSLALEESSRLNLYPLYTDQCRSPKSCSAVQWCSLAPACNLSCRVSTPVYSQDTARFFGKQTSINPNPKNPKKFQIWKKGHP